MNCTLCNNPSVDFFADSKGAYYKCETCALIFLSPEYHLNPKDEKLRYDTHKNSPEDENYIAFLNKLINPMLSIISEGDIGLDFGCGPGPAINFILEQKSIKVNLYDPFYYPDNSLLETKYDFITCTETVEHFYNPQKEFQLLKSLMKEDRSHLGIMTEFITKEIDFSTWWYRNDPTHVCFYSTETFEWIAKEFNLSLNIPQKNVVILSRK